MLRALILAAGESTRMGRPKALLKDPDGRAFVARIVRTFAEAGIADITIVTGSQHDAIAAAVAADDPPVDAAHRAQPRSLARPALVALDGARDRWPGHTGRADDAGRRADAPRIDDHGRRSTRGSGRTHRSCARPWAIATVTQCSSIESTFDELRRAPLNEGAKAVVHALAERVVNVPVDDPGCLVDIDTPDDYNRAMQEGQ